MIGTGAQHRQGVASNKTNKGQMSVGEKLLSQRERGNRTDRQRNKRSMVHITRCSTGSGAPAQARVAIKKNQMNWMKDKLSIGANYHKDKENKTIRQEDR